MRVAMGAAGGRSRRSAGLAADPAASPTWSTTSSSRRSPTRRFYGELDPATASPTFGLVLGAVIALAGIALAYRIWVAEPGTRRARLRARFAGAAPPVRQQVVLRRADRPARRAAGRGGRALRASRRSSAWSSTARSSAARPALVRAGSAAVRAVADRLPALLRRAAAARRWPALGLYFLIVERDDRPPLDPLWLPARGGAARRASLPRRAGAARRRSRGALADARATRSSCSSHFDTGRRACSTSPTRRGSPSSASTTSSASTG